MNKLTLLAGFLAAATVAQAADSKWGVVAGLSLPQGKVADSDHLDGNMGTALGVTLQFDLGQGHALTPRLDLTSYTRSKDGADYNVSSVAIGADYNFYPAGRVGEGLYLIGGLQFAQVKHELKYGSLSLSDTPTNLQVSLGAGYQFNRNWFGEVRYTSVSVEPKIDVAGYRVSETVACPALNVTVGYRF